MADHLPALSGCPTANSCNVTFEKAPSCGQSPDHLPPELLAEQLCPAAVAGAIAAEKAHPIETRSNRGRAIAGKEFRLGGLYFDLALSVKEDPSTTRSHLATAEGHLAEAASRRSHPGGINAAFLRLYLPTAHSRNMRALPLEQVTDIRNGLREILDQTETDTHLIHTRAAFHLLYLRESKLASAVTARELGYFGSNNISPRQVPLGHSLYTIDHVSRKKIPHRLETPTTGASTREILRVHFNRISKEAINKVTPNVVDTALEAGKLTLDWLYDEAAGDALVPKRQRILDEMGHILNRQQRSFLQRNQNPTDRR